jgi:hypothetical protein
MQKNQTLKNKKTPSKHQKTQAKQSSLELVG